MFLGVRIKQLWTKAAWSINSIYPEGWVVDNNRLFLAYTSSDQAMGSLPARVATGYTEFQQHTIKVLLQHSKMVQMPSGDCGFIRRLLSRGKIARNTQKSNQVRQNRRKQ